VYEVQREGHKGRTRVLHRNLLRQVDTLPITEPSEERHKANTRKDADPDDAPDAYFTQNPQPHRSYQPQALGHPPLPPTPYPTTPPITPPMPMSTLSLP
jgi:hypothetical protein